MGFGRLKILGLLGHGPLGGFQGSGQLLNLTGVLLQDELVGMLLGNNAGPEHSLIGSMVTLDLASIVVQGKLKFLFVGLLEPLQLNSMPLLSHGKLQSVLLTEHCQLLVVLLLGQGQFPLNLLLALGKHVVLGTPFRLKNCMVEAGDLAPCLVPLVPDLDQFGLELLDLGLASLIRLGPGHFLGQVLNLLNQSGYEAGLIVDLSVQHREWVNRHVHGLGILAWLVRLMRLVSGVLGVGGGMVHGRLG